MKFIKSNVGFIIGLTLLITIALIPEAKSLILKGLIKTDLYEPDFIRAEDNKQAAVPPAVFLSSTGERVDIADSRGKVIFLNFWAAWCPPCLAEMPDINKLAAQFKYERNVIFLMANVDGDLNASENFLKKKGYYLDAFIPVGKVPKQIFEGSLPTTVIISKSGEVVYKHEGIADYGSLETTEFIKRLIQEKR